MAAKLLHSLTDDNPDLQKQIGCMTGIFQIFDRQHIMTPRRMTGHSPRRIPSGNSHNNNSTSETELNNIYHITQIMENNSNKNAHEKQRASTESSRASFSSSSRSSSFSSLDCNKTAKPESLSFDRMIFPEISSKDLTMKQTNASPQFERQNLDLRDVVKDSMYRESRGLSVKTKTKEVSADRLQKRRDSPRPLQLAEIYGGAYSMGHEGKPNMPGDKESIKVFAKLREAPWYVDEPRELSRSASYNSRDGLSYSIPKDAPRFSYDERVNPLSFESQTLRLRELPRLSLDSRQSSMRNFNSDSKSNIMSRSTQKGNSSEQVPGLHQASTTQTRPPSVVAKLMGLETLPDSASNSESKMSSISIKSSPVKESDPFSRISKVTDLGRPIEISSSRTSWKKPTSPRWKEPTSPRWKNPDSMMKPFSRLPIEPAPWKQLDGARGYQKLASRHLKSPVKAPSAFPSVYSEIEKRLKDLEFRQSGKDLRALKQILEAMQVKGLLETSKGGQDSNFSNRKDNEQIYTNPIQNTRLVNQRKPQRNNTVTYKERSSNSSRTFESPIVIMKPAKLVEKSVIPSSSVIPLDGVATIHKLHGCVAENIKGSVNIRTTKDQIPKSCRRDNVVNSTDMKTNVRNLKLNQTSTRHQQLPKESNTSSLKSLGSISPRLQQKKLELEKRSRPPTPPSDSSRSRKQSNKQQAESSSPGGRRRPKSSDFQQSDDQASEISSETKNLSYRENETSLQSDGSILVDSTMDIEVTSSIRCSETKGSQSSSMQDLRYSPGLVQKKSTLMLTEDESPAELAAISPEYPSPVSVLDNAVYIDDTPSPVKQILGTLNENCARNLNESFTKEQLDPANKHISTTIASGLTSDVNRKKLQNIEHLVQKLQRLNSSHDEARTDYIASLCENTNPNHRYISEILLASGLLLRDLGSSLTTFQFHPSGHPINPELFLVLEQTKASNLLKEECGAEKVVQPKSDKEKFHRKLIFDVVNEILIGKLSFVGLSSEPWLLPQKVANNTPNAQKLLRELCLEIEQLQAKKTAFGLEDEDEDDGLKSILWEDVIHHSESWTDFQGEISGLVLDVERFLFKELIDEIVIGEAAGLRLKTGRHRRQVFVK